MKKRIVIALLFSLILMVACSFITLSAQSAEEPQLKIEAANLSFSESVYTVYAVSYDGVAAEDISLLVWTAPQTDYAVGTEAEILSPEESHVTVKGKDCLLFAYRGIAAREMGDDIYVRAYTEGDDGTAYYSEVVKYSVLQYVFNILPETEDEKLKALLLNMLQYGASAQIYADYKTDRLVTSDFYQVTVEGGTLADGSTHGLYLEGDEVTVAAPVTNKEGATFAYWADSKNNKISTTATFELIVGTTNEIYTPVYLKYSNGLEFESNGDGTCCLLGMGDCSDTDLVIPPTSPDGDRVTEIDGSAFAGEALTSVSFPSTITSIGRKAFNGCDSLTDVYYDGTEEAWLEIDIGTYNTPIETATMHFNEPPVQTFTVTFVDYDGTVLGTDTVESGKNATAPEAPTRNGYTFVGWDKTFDNVTEDITVTAEYSYKVSVPTILVEGATASAGESITVTVNIASNPGVAGAKFKVDYDPKLTLTNATSGEAFSVLDYTPPSTFTSGCPFNWDSLDAESTVDGTVLTLTFTISENASVGDELNISVSYVYGDVYNANLDDLNFDLVDGIITVV